MKPKSCCKTVREQGLVVGRLMGLVTSKKRVGEMVSLADDWEKRDDLKVLEWWRLAWPKRGSRNRRGRR